MAESLLKKYDIPINHLDFDYIKTCENAKEIEKIVAILKSGEEGYFQKLTDCALTKLRSLNPNSKILREETPVLNKRSMINEEWNDLSENINIPMTKTIITITTKCWTEKIKKQSDVLHEWKSFDGFSNVHPIRQFSETNSIEDEPKKSNIKRIKSYDYAQWDKYNPEVEILKMDLNEESQAEQMQSRKDDTVIDHTKTQEIVEKLSSIEKDDLANRHRIKGNEFYKSADFEEAIQEYTRSIEIFPTASAFNNRAITYLKMKNLEMTIADCEQGLKLEPNNIKSLLRKAQALLNQLKYREAYDECTKILFVDSTNEWAKNQISQIKLKNPHLPPANAFRMKIVEDEPKLKNEAAIPVKDDFANLIIPNKILPSKLHKLKSNFALNSSAIENRGKMQKSAESDDREISAELNFQSKSKITEYCNGVIIEELN